MKKLTIWMVLLAATLWPGGVQAGSLASTACLPGSLDLGGAVFNRPVTSPFPPCMLSSSATAVLYQSYEFALSGCPGATVVANICGRGACNTTGTLTAAKVYIYQKADRSAQAFNASRPCDNLVAVGLTSPCGTELTEATATLSAGNFVVVVAADNNIGTGATGTQKGTFNLSVNAPTCTVTPVTSCTFAINPLNKSFRAAGGSGSTTVTVTAGTSCAWTAISNDDGLTVDSGSSGVGNGTVTYTVPPNNGPARVGTITIAGQTFTVTQEAGQVTLPCIMDALVAGDSTFARPIVSPALTCPGQSNVFFKDYEFTLAGCASGPVTVNTCGNGSCGSAGTLDTVLYIYQKVDGSASTGGSPIFSPAAPCANAVAANNNGCADGIHSTVTANLRAGIFVVVVAANASNQIGTFNLSLAAAGGCTITPPCTLACPANVIRASDPNQCGAAVTYAAPVVNGECGTVACVPPSGSFFPAGTTTVNCTGTDAGNTLGSCSFTVRVNTATVPAIGPIAASPASLRLHNGLLTDVTLNYAVTDVCDANPTCIVSSITSNENIPGDMVIVDGHHVRLRDSLSRQSKGRFYDITVRCTNLAGASATRTVRVTVPR